MIRRRGFVGRLASVPIYSLLVGVLLAAGPPAAESWARGAIVRPTIAPPVEKDPEPEMHSGDGTDNDPSDPDADPADIDELSAATTRTPASPGARAPMGSNFLSRSLGALGDSVMRLRRLPLVNPRRGLADLLVPRPMMDELWQPPRPHRAVVFQSLDLTRHARFLGLGAKHAPGGRMDRPGWRVMATLGVKIADFDPVIGAVSHRISSARLLAGREWHLGPLAVTALAGPSLLRHQPGAAAEAGRRLSLGAAGALDLWLNWPGQARWTSRHSFASLLLDGAERSANLRFQHGFALAGTGMRFGPEISYSTGGAIRARSIVLQGGWRKLRAGLHFSEIPFISLRLGASLGAEWQERQKPGFYLALSAYRLIY